MIKINLATSIAVASAPTEGMSGDIIYTMGDLRKQALLRLLILAAFPGALWGYQQAKLPELVEKQTAAQKKLEDLQKYNGQMEKSVQEIKKFKEDEAKIQVRISTIDHLAKNRYREIKVIDLVQQVIPEKVWLTKLEANDGKVSIAGHAMTDFEVSSFMESLAKSVHFVDVNLVTSAEAQIDGVAVKSFEIACSLEKSQ